LAPVPGQAQSGKLEAAYVVLGGGGAIARAILSDAATCPAITIGGGTQPMRIRARPDTAFMVLVCEAAIPAGATAAAIEGRALPVPKPKLSAIAVFGDTGCRLKAARPSAHPDPHEAGRDEKEAGQFQARDQSSKWPFAGLSATVAARKPDLVIHVGDYVYRESPCPPADAGCKGTPTATNGRPGRPISSGRRRGCSRPHRGSSRVAITRSASARARASSAFSILAWRRTRRRRPASSGRRSIP
jgi:hypothetical protein